MTSKKRKEIEEIALNVYHSMNDARAQKEEAEECCASRMMTAQEYAVLDINNMSKDDLFKKVVNELPLVYHKEYPTEFLSFDDWRFIITRENLISAEKLTKKEYAFFDELSLTEIKNYFASQLEKEFYDTLNNVKQLHSSIIKKYYDEKNQKKTTTTTKKGRK